MGYENVAAGEASVVQAGEENLSVKEDSSFIERVGKLYSTRGPELNLDGTLRGWLALGVLWFLLGVALAPSSKPYNQILIVLFWIPALILCFREREAYGNLFAAAKPLIAGLTLIFLWAGVSLLWAENIDPFRELKRLVYVALFLFGLAFVARDNVDRLVLILRVAGIGLAVAALVSLISFYGIKGLPLTTRLEGTGLLDHPIIGGYLIAISLLWLSSIPPVSRAARAGWLACLVLLFVYAVMTQSRGLWTALLGAQLGFAMLQGGVVVWIASVAMVAFAGLGFWQFESIILERGTSYRPEIFFESVRMMLDRPIGGLGLGTEYDVVVEEWVFPHSHNLFLHVGLELGAVGLLIWLWIWGCCLKVGWHHRKTPCGSALLKIMLFCSIALMFDGNSLWTAPRPDWFFSWLPLGLALAIVVSARDGSKSLSGR
ncbi:O-antigen ligase family protein [Pseudomonas sp. gcc21]|uniref:O-antigen ligase family protein n=1 Tax=Pseudomonas sp. gcc21 TaxID=2726989 RepID=UPI001452695D|nr:O-antigen ligase family protein [Pseudomonas sp. gcc21]QJD59013.1 O-antigen ligase family protein [Pseudomonas sp. gcc21]